MALYGLFEFRYGPYRHREHPTYSMKRRFWSESPFRHFFACFGKISMHVSVCKFQNYFVWYIWVLFRDQFKFLIDKSIKLFLRSVCSSLPKLDIGFLHNLEFSQNKYQLCIPPIPYKNSLFDFSSRFLKNFLIIIFIEGPYARKQYLGHDPFQKHHNINVKWE